MPGRCSQKACAYPVEREGLCVFHLRDRDTLGLNIASVEETAVAEEKETSMVTTDEKCFCGSPKGHRGRHRGRVTSTASKPRPATSDITTDEIIAELKKRRDKLTLAIE